MALPYELPPLDIPEPEPAGTDESALLVEAARAQAAAIRAQAREEGLQLGRAAARDELATTLAALRAAAAGLAAVRDEVAERTEAAAVDLALRLAEKVVAGAVDVQPERILDAVRGALRCLAERERVVVLVHPDDLAIVRDHAAALAAELGGIEHLEVQQERRVARGDAVVRTAEAEVDARVATKLERARCVVEEELRA